jgi:hypothetical protein
MPGGLADIVGGGQADDARRVNELSEGTKGTEKIYNEETKPTETNGEKMLPVIPLRLRWLRDGREHLPSFVFVLFVPSL